MKKRIMHITQSNGGVARYLQMFFKYSSIEYENILVYPKMYESERELFEEKLNKIEFIEMEREINFSKDFKAVREISKLIKIYNPDLIYAHSSKAGALARIANLKNKKAIIYNPHGWAFDMKVGKLKKILYIIIEKMLALACDNIITISEAEKKSALNKRICNRRKIEKIINGIDIEEYESMRFEKESFREKNGIKKNDIVIGMVGRISLQKAPDNFIQVASMIKKKYSNAFFVIVGDGEERKNIERLIDESDLTDSVLITGWVENIYDYINIFDVALLLSRWEGFGLAITEYMISKVPIVSTNVGAINELITNEKSGLLVEVDNIRDTVKAIDKILKNKEFATKMINQADKIVRKEFNVKRVVRQTEELYKVLLNK